MFLVARIGLGILAIAAAALLPGREPVDVPGWPAPDREPGWQNAITTWERWDGLWYLRIADDGYRDGDGSAAFFPGYPLLVRAMSFALGGHPLAAGLVVSHLAFLAALLLVYGLTRDELGERAARRTVLLIAVFPTAVFFFAPYPEGMFLALAAGALWAARRGAWPVAGLAALGAAGTRQIGLALVPALAFEALRQWRARGGAHGVRALAWSVLPVAGTAAYLLFWEAASGDWLAPVHQQGNWLRDFSYPWEALVDGVREGLGYIGTYPGGYHLMDLIVVAPVLAAGVWVALRTAAPFAVYTAASIAVPLSFVFGGRPFMSFPRFVLPMFPIFWAIGAFADRFRAHEAVVAISAALLGVTTVLFVAWYWVF